MKTIFYLTFDLLFALLLVACAGAAPQPSEELINPGDRIGDFLITNTESEAVIYVFEYGYSCTEQDVEDTYTCTYPAGSKINLTTGLYDNSAYHKTPSEQLIQDWNNFGYELYINDRPVNLEAFGIIETMHPVIGVMRFWNVVLVADQPGELTVHDIGTKDGQPFDQTLMWTFSEP